ncbi:MAG TPA: His-Xaa-Ser system protein HxsD [bacterium]|nr:His-Xaa-Ser system protein HxsD [bacterium]
MGKNQVVEVDIAKDRLTILVDKSIYKQEAILNATYFYIDDFYVFLSRQDEEIIKVELRSKEKMNKSSMEKAGGEFYNNLLAEALRLEVGKTNKRMRERLLEQAISSAMSPPKPKAEPAGSGKVAGKESAGIELTDELKKIIERTKDVSYEDDPLGISTPIDDQRE